MRSQRLRWIRLMQLVLLCGCSVVSFAVPTYAKSAGTCEDPILIPGGSDEYQFDLGSGEWRNNENHECLDSLATGPDIVLICDFSCADGVVTWEADYDAIVYIRGEEGNWSCDAPCVSSSTTGRIAFDSNWGMDFWGDVHCDFNYIIVDGLNGASGTIDIVVQSSDSTPVVEMSWGQIRRRYR